jgi:glycosyltransferase involved in cell wall biosynthesis
LGLGERARFLGPVPQDRLADLYNAADVLVLASTREGCPNVLLEALACGTPVVAAAAGGVPEIVRDPVAGRLVAERTPEAFADAVRDLLADPPAGAAVRAYAERFDWGPTSAGQLRMFRSILGRSA